MTRGLKISPTLSLPLDAVTETFAILAKRRAGKSNAAVVMAEEMYDHGLPWVAVDPKGDWWGVRADGDATHPGLAVLVFGGLHGDVPLEPTAGNLVADLIVEERLTCVLDVSEMSKADQRRFLTDFASRLYRKNTEPLHVFCEEADEYIPQRVTQSDTRLVGAFESLIKRGGFRGIGITLITQRSASLNKDVLTQIETLIPMRTPSPQDRKAILAWVDVHDAGKELVDDLPGLADGEAYVFSPQWLGTLEKIRFRRRRTFDSGSTPKVGGKPTPPKALAEIDLASIKEAMAETIEKAKADDPKLLRKRIAELERAAAKVPLAAPLPEPEIIEVPALDPGYAKQLADVIEPLTEILTSLSTTLFDLKHQPQKVDQGGVSRSIGRVLSRPAHPRPPASDTYAMTDAGQVTLRKGARRILETLARNSPMRLTKPQLGTLAKIKHTGGTFSTYWGELNRLGFIDSNGTDFTLTQAGFDYIGVEPGNPQTTDEILAAYRAALRAGARTMLDIVVEAYPDSVERWDLAQRAGITSTGGTFSTYLGELRRNGLIEVHNGMVTANDILFPGGST